MNHTTLDLGHWKFLCQLPMTLVSGSIYTSLLWLISKEVYYLRPRSEEVRLRVYLTAKFRIFSEVEGELIRRCIVLVNSYQ